MARGASRPVDGPPVRSVVDLFLPSSVLAVTAGLLGAGMWFGQLYASTDASAGEVMGIGSGFLAFSVVGTFVATRRPRNRLGWLFIGIGAFAGIGLATTSYAYDALLVRDGAPLGNLAAWLQAWAWMALLCSFAFVFLLFPDGRPPSPRWRIVSWLGMATIATFALIAALRPEFSIGQTEWGLRAPNPWGLRGSDDVLDAIETAAFAALAVTVLLSLVATVVRYGRARGSERAQLKWFVFGAVFTSLLAVTLDAIPLPEQAQWSGLLMFWVIPVTTGVAVLRYRLYDIDRVVSRTVAYVLLTAVLLGVYATGVVGLGGLFQRAAGGPRSDVVVAVTTLIVAALFQPLRRRLQTLVDRQFDRHHYDAVRVVERFGGRVRNAVDLDSLESELRDVVGQSVRPSHVSMWTGSVRPLP